MVQDKMFVRYMIGETIERKAKTCRGPIIREIRLREVTSRVKSGWENSTRGPRSVDTMEEREDVR